MNSIGSIDEEFILLQLKGFNEFSKKLSNEGNRLEYVSKVISTTEECMDKNPTNNALVKRMVTWALKEFNSSKSKSDIRMLGLWKLLGKYSTDLKMEGVLNQVHQFGFFKKVPEFYVIWAEYWAEQNNREKFDGTIKLCEENCALDDIESEKLFGELIRKYYKDDDTIEDFEADQTQALFDFIAQGNLHPDKDVDGSPIKKIKLDTNTNGKPPNCEDDAEAEDYRLDLHSYMSAISEEKEDGSNSAKKPRVCLDINLEQTLDENQYSSP